MRSSLNLPSLENVETLSKRIYSSLETAILEGKIKPDDHLVEEELSKMFGISRAPIREALRWLDKDGLVRIVPRKGAVVQSISEKDIQDIYEIRSVMEGLAARLFCERASEEELRKIDMIVKNAQMISPSHGHKQTYRRLNREFHDAIILGSKNEKILETYNHFRKQIAWFQNVTLAFDFRFEVSLKEHKQLLALFLKRDSEKAEIQARQHIENAAKILISEFEKRSNRLGKPLEEKRRTD